MDIILLPFHFLHHRHGGDDVVDGPVGVDHLAGEAVGIDGVAQTMGIGTAVFVDGEQIQLVLAL